MNSRLPSPPPPDKSKYYVSSDPDQIFFALVTLITVIVIAWAPCRKKARPFGKYSTFD